MAQALDDQLDGLLALVRSNPKAAYGDAIRLGSVAAEQNRQDLLSQFCRAAGEAARHASTLDDSLLLLGQAVAAADRAGRPDLSSEARFTRSGSLAMAGRNTDALDELDRIDPYGDGDLRSRIDFQRASIHARSGNHEEAVRLFTRSLPSFERTANHRYAAMVRHNRGMLLIGAGDTRAARADFVAARALYEKLGQSIFVVGMDHNLGLAALREGEIRTALELFDESERRLADLTDQVHEVQGARVEALLSAGLFERARALAVEMHRSLRRVGLLEDAAEAQLLAAHASLSSGRAESALNHAVAARRLFESQDRAGWVVAARHAEIKARWAAGQASVELRDEARATADALEENGQLVAGADCRLVAGRLSLDLGRSDDASADLRRLEGIHTGPFELQLQGWLARALLRIESGDRRGADAAARAGFRLVASAQAAFAASDMRAGLARHARDLGAIGIRLALDARAPRRVWRWLERTRASALLVQPVDRSADPEAAELLSELRRVTAELRTAAWADTQRLVRRQVTLQRRVRRISERAAGSGDADGIVDADALRTAAEEWTVVQFGHLDGSTMAVIVTTEGFRLVEVGGWESIARDASHLRESLHRAVQGRRSRGEVAKAAARLDARLFGPLPIGSRKLVLVPPSHLFALPWSILPTTRGRPVSVAPSSTAWLRARNRFSSGSSMVAVAGPSLSNAAAEARTIAGLYGSSRRFSPSRARVGAVLRALQGARIAHLATHGVLEGDNPLFSSLELADGDLLVHDLERAGSAPEIVVLSACETGTTPDRFSGEVLGFVGSLLGLGARAIVAGIGLIPDSAATTGVMVELHRRLAMGVAPASALAEVQALPSRTEEDYVAKASFVCFGAG